MATIRRNGYAMTKICSEVMFGSGVKDRRKSVNELTEVNRKGRGRYEFNFVDNVKRAHENVVALVRTDQ